MRNDQSAGVKRGTIEQDLLATVRSTKQVAAGEPITFAVKPVAENPVPDVRQMDANLVGPPGLGKHLQCGESAQPQP